MSSPTFASLAEARAHANTQAIEHAVLPFHGVLEPARLVDLRQFLTDALETHVFIRTLSTRAANALWAPFAPPKLQKAARLAGEEEEGEAPPGKVPVERREAPIPTELPGGVKLTDPRFFHPSRQVIDKVAAQIFKQWGSPPEEEDLVQEGWVITSKVWTDWDPKRAAYKTFIWGRVRTHLLDEVKKRSNRRERTVRASYPDDMADNQFDSKDAVACLQAALDASAISWVLGYERELEPDERVIQAERSANLHAAIGELPDNEQKVIAARDFDDLTCDQASEKLGIANVTVRRQHQRAFNTIRARLDEGSNVTSLVGRKKRPPKK